MAISDDCIRAGTGAIRGLDHFGIEVEDLDDTIARIGKFDSSLSALKRPPDPALCRLSAHDPDTNIFDLSQKDIGFKRRLCRNNGRGQTRAHGLAHRRCARARRTLRRILYGGVRLKTRRTS